MIQEKIVKYLNFKGISKYKFYKETGFSNGFLDKTGAIGSDKCEIICSHYPDLNIEWLILDKGEMISSKKFYRDSITNETMLNTLLDIYDIKNAIPVYPHIATAGAVQLFKDFRHDQSDGFIHVPNMPKCDGAIPVVGDSMYPLLKSGDLVCYKVIDVPDIIYGEMYIVDWTNSRGDDYLTVKYVAKGSNKDVLKLISYNKHHDDIEVNKATIRQLALVKLTVRFNTL